MTELEKRDFELMVRLEGIKLKAYDCPKNIRTVGVGTSLEKPNIRDIWKELEIKEDFDKVFNKEIKISMETAKKLFEYDWNDARQKVIHRIEELKLPFKLGDMPFWKQFILIDIAYNTGSVKKWKKVFLRTNPKDVLYEARRHPYELMDSRVAKIGYYFGIIDTLEEARELGLEYAKYIK